MDHTNRSNMVFSLGQGGYDRAFADAVKSQQDYCVRYGYEYCCIAQPGSPVLGRENIWLKALAFYGALLRNDYVLYVDTDVRMQRGCPSFEQAVSEENPIGLVAGHSGRINAGVLIAKRTPRSLAFFAEWVASLGKPIAARHDVGWGENGHLIRLVDKYAIRPIDTRWNNTFDRRLDDYLRHYTGPLRQEYTFEGDAKVAWDRITADVTISNSLEAADILTSFSELKEVYDRTVPQAGFASFDACWEEPRRLVAGHHKTTARFEPRVIRQVHVAEDISAASPNAYVLTLKEGLERSLGADRVGTGVDLFWDGSFGRDEVVHIEWIESLFRWKVPTEDQVVQFERRMAEIARTTAIVYTAHNFDLMPTYGESRTRMLEALARCGSLICHLSEANIGPYNTHHRAIRGLQDLPTSLVPHGDYQPYYRAEQVPFEDPALQTGKFKILVFGHIRTRDELEFCLEVGTILGQEDFQLVFAGAIHPDILHWKEIHRLRDAWDGGARRLHFKVPGEQVVSLVSQCDALLVPRFDRLNSGVQFLAYTLLKPAFVPAQNSMQEVQVRAVGQGVFQPLDAQGAAQAIRAYVGGGATAQLLQRYDVNAFNYAHQGVDAVGAAHRAAYEKAIAYHHQKTNTDKS